MDNLQLAIQEAKRFSDPVHRRLNAALKRASLDLTKALPALRR